MSDYFEARKARFIRNEEALIQLIKDVKEKNPNVEVYVYKNQPFIDSVTFFLGEDINGVGFHEVPYRWSGCGYTEYQKSHHGLEMPFTANDILTTFSPVTNWKKSNVEYFKSKDHYLKWCSYLINYELK